MGGSDDKEDDDNEDQDDNDDGDEKKNDDEGGDVDEDSWNKVGQPPFTLTEIAAFLRGLFKLSPGQLHTVTNKFERRKVDKTKLLAFCAFCNSRASLEMRGNIQ